MTQAAERFDTPFYVQQDWPGPGPIDLDVHDLPHDSSRLEWWYLHAHLDVAGEPMSIFASFFRMRLEDDGEPAHAHALTWALIHPDQQGYVYEALVDPDTPQIALDRLEREGPRDPRIRRATKEVLERGRVVGPDILLRAPARVGRDRLHLELDGRVLHKQPDGSLRLRLSNEAGNVECTLTFTLAKPVVRHGDDGVVRGKGNEDMFYYLCPRCSVEGTVRIDGVDRAARGSGWYDHEFGAPADRDAAEASSGASWNWLAVQLDDGRELSVYDLYENGTLERRGSFAVLIGLDGQAERYTDFTLEGTDAWVSTRTFTSYPTRWSLSIPAAGVELTARAALPAQEIITMITEPAFWEGRVEVEGTIDGTPVRGPGFIERTGFVTIDTLDAFFAAVGEMTRASVRRILPLELDKCAAAQILGLEERPRCLDGVDFGQLSGALAQPVRSIVDRGGKAWRSYCALACCDIVGGDSEALREWLALPELLHVGSLIIDDVEDRSAIRRSGPAAHVAYGEATAINAGSFCYFLPHLFIRSSGLPPEGRLRLYELYFTAVRAAHGGQAIDIAGLAGALDDVVESGRSDDLEARILAVHRLKSGTPARSLGEMGALLGGGSDAQIEALGRYLEEIGVAFQVVDDVLNLAGFRGGLKTRGEDLIEGKVTLPVAKAMSRLDLPGRRSLHSQLLRVREDPTIVAEVVETIESTGALTACRTQAEAMVEDAWQMLRPQIDDSAVSLKLRAFGWFVLDRHY